MLKYILIFSLMVTSTAICQVNELWNQRYNGTGNGIDQAVDMVLDAAGNSYITGISNNGSDFDVVTVKYNSAGVLQWTNTYGGSGLDEPRAMVIDNSGDIIVVGSRFISGGDWDIFTLKINSGSGTQSWAELYSGSAFFDLGNDVAIDASNNIYVAGSYYQSSNNLDYVLLKYNSSGTFQWDNTGGSTLSDEGLLVEVDNAGDILLGGTAEFSNSSTFFDFRVVKINNAGTTIWTKTEDSGFGKLDKPRAMALDGSGNVYIGGSGFTTVANLEDMLLMKISSTGTVDWKKLYSGNNQANDFISDLVIDPTSNNIYVTGKIKSTLSAEDFHTRAYDNSGTLLWSKTYSSAGNNFDEATGIAFKNNFLYVTGYTFVSGQSNNYNTIKYDLSGNEMWLKSFNYTANQSDKSYKINVDSQDNVFVTGASYTSTGQNLDYTTIKYCQLETIASNDTAICIGNSTTLSANAVGGFNYIWTVVSGTPASPASMSCTSCQSPVVTPTVTTVYAVQSQNGIGCIDFDTLTVTVNIATEPIITSNSPLAFCTGDSIVLSVNNQNYDTYSWNNGGSNAQNTVLSSGMQIVTVTDTNGCQSADTVTTSHYSLPTVDAGLNTDVCQGQSAQLQASGAMSYLWNANTSLSQYIISNPIATPPTTQTYYVTGTDVNGCKGTDSITVSVNANPTISVTGGGAICIGDSVQLSASGATNYSWNNPSSLTNSWISNPIAFPTQFTNYTVTGTDGNNCQGQGTVTIIVNNLPFISTGVDQTICNGDSVNLFATGGASYQWETSASLSATNISNPWASPTTTTSYIVEGTDANNCSQTDTVSVIVNSIPNINAGVDTAVCLFESITLNATGAVSYLWNPNPSLTGNNIANPTVQPVIPTTYIVTGTNSNGCSASDTILVSVHSLPSISAGSDLAICFGDSIQLNVTGGISYQWNFDATLSQLNIMDPYASPTVNTTYYVTGTDINGCTNTDNVAVSINQLPNIFAGNDLIICEGTSTQLQASGGVSYTWDNTPNLVNLNVFNPQTTTLNSTEWFFVTGIDNNNCENRDSVKVTVNPLPSPPVLTSTFPYIVSSYVFGNSWYFNGNLLSNLTNDSIDYVNLGNLGTYTATHTDFNGCTSSMSSGLTITSLVDGASISEYLTPNLSFKAYPNPLEAILNIELYTEIDHLIITDISGKIILRSDGLEPDTHSFDLSDHESGVYIVTVFSQQNSKSLKVIKQ